MASPSERASCSPMPEMLTPRTKIARMMADIENDISPTPSARALPPAKAANADASNASSGPGRGPFEAESSSSSDDADDDDVPRPKGRAARRMLDLDRSPPRYAPSSARRIASSPPVNTNALSAHDDGDHDLYSRTPLKARSTGEGSMAGTPVANDASDLFMSPAGPKGDNNEDELPSNPFGSKEKLAELVAKKREERLRREAAEAEQRQRRRLEEAQEGSLINSRHRKNQQRRRREHRASDSAHASSDLPDGVLEGSPHEVDPDIERIMSDAARPARKASKKALLEMERETQRMARQQALAHQMKVKKKFTTTDLMARFNVRRPQPAERDARSPGTPQRSSSAPNSDGFDSHPRDPVSTPPSSPPTVGPTPLQKQAAIVDQGALSKLIPVREDSITSLAQMADSDEELPDIAEVLSSSRAAPTKPQPVQPMAIDPFETMPRTEPKRGFRLAKLGKKKALVVSQQDSDDDGLEIIAPMPAHLKAFDKVMAKPANRSGMGSKAIHTLRHLSHIGAYEAKPQKGSKVGRLSISANVLEAQLRRKAKDQARQQQLERIAELKAKGIEIQTAEEREREAEVFENLLEKARLEAQELRKAERAAARGELDGDGNPADASDDEDEDFDYEQSGSEDEARPEDYDDDDDGREEGSESIDGASMELNEEEAEHDADSAAQIESSGKVGDDENPINELNNGTAHASAVVTPVPALKKARKSRIIADDDDEDEDAPAANLAAPNSAAAEEDDPFAAFGFGADDTSASLMNPTQAFQATMQTPTQATQDDSFDILRRIAPPSSTSMPPTRPRHYDLDSQSQPDESQLSVVPGSQVPDSQRIKLNLETQAPETPVPAGLTRGASALSETPGWEPTQDPGLPSPWSAGLRRQATLESINEEPETQETVRLRISESPIASAAPTKRGRLVRRQAAVLAESSDDEGPAPTALVKAKKIDAFKEMARRRAEILTADERAEVDREMKQMMEEQAEESEDEYAGIGGDDFVAPETEEDRAMIDSSHIDVNERALAAHFAERERLRNEEETNRLYKDLTTGALRRKQANAWGLEEDEDEIAMRRRQMKQREEARKRKLLLQDDNIAGLAQGRQTKGKDAFLKAIADDDDGDDVLDLSDVEDNSQQFARQDESQSSQLPSPRPGPLDEVSGNKRRLADDETVEGRPAAKLRRTQPSAFRKPTSMLEVRESLSFLLEEPETIVAAPTVDLSASESEDEYGLRDDEEGLLADENEEQEEVAEQNDGGFAPIPDDFDARAMPPPRLPASLRRTAPKPAVVDRLSLKRGSSTSSATGSAPGRSAWAAPTTAAFKAPSLLRRATTNMATTGVTALNLSRENSGSGVKIGGSKKSSLAYQARAEERKAIVEASAKKREENTKRIAEMRRGSSALGRGLTGKFE
ncbi:hypothetical protein EJ03DRAFT_333150 [Teratosphaeria nubilosa]|uniref:DNA replication checkpoint mediator MRC1 domain-containing protein n=1 Tax=Teratosphaeria nubilosa TaxID=161662 RepID=A0A6G1LN74_9PEZI|nr:hypothetical protein EJ03DRAFT_333150 [Teratosphaeria nubilosa]